jgi:hypothetical protein
MANARIYFAPTTPQGIVVGEEIPPAILERAISADKRRRERTKLLDQNEDDLNWLTEDENSR